MDRTIRGLIAGVVAGFIKNIWNLTDYYLLHLTKIRFLDWFGVLSNWERPANSLETIIYFVLQTVVWDGFLGVAFANMVPLITSKAIVYKSTLYSMLLWFIFKVIVNLFRVPFLSGKQPLPGRISNILSIILWGVLMGLVLKKLEKPIEQMQL